MRNRGEGDGGGVRKHLYYGVFVVITCVASLHFKRIGEVFHNHFRKRQCSQSNPTIAVILLRFKTARYWKGCYRVSVDAFLVTEAFRWGGVDD